MEEKFRRRVEQLIKTIQFEDVNNVSMKPKDELLSEFEQILDKKLISFFSNSKIKTKLEENYKKTNKISFKLELCDELQVPLPFYWTKIDIKPKTIFKKEVITKIETIEDLISKVPLNRKEIWKNNIKNSSFNNFLYNELRYHMLTNSKKKKNLKQFERLFNDKIYLRLLYKPNKRRI